jgi:hypothetical protein
MVRLPWIIEIVSRSKTPCLTPTARSSRWLRYCRKGASFSWSHQRDVRLRQNFARSIILAAHLRVDRPVLCALCGDHIQSASRSYRFLFVRGVKRRRLCRRCVLDVPRRLRGRAGMAGPAPGGRGYAGLPGACGSRRARRRCARSPAAWPAVSGLDAGPWTGRAVVVGWGKVREWPGRRDVPRRSTPWSWQSTRSPRYRPWTAPPRACPCCPRHPSAAPTTTSGTAPPACSPPMTWPADR